MVVAVYASGQEGRKSCAMVAMMQIFDTELAGVKIIEPKVFSDNRGYFLETFNVPKYRDAGITQEFVQDNLSCSKRGVLRGLHLQNPILQGKLVTVLTGKVLDVAVDVRIGSPTFGRYVSVTLDDRTHRQFWIPRGFAHGFVVLSEECKFMYKCDAPYDRESEIGIRWDDPDINIDWGIEHPILSEKDAAAPLLKDLTSKLPVFRA